MKRFLKFQYWSINQRKHRGIWTKLYISFFTIFLGTSCYRHSFKPQSSSTFEGAHWVTAEAWICSVYICTYHRHENRHTAFPPHSPYSTLCFLALYTSVPFKEQCADTTFSFLENDWVVNKEHIPTHCTCLQISWDQNAILHAFHFLVVRVRSSHQQKLLRTPSNLMQLTCTIRSHCITS